MTPFGGSFIAWVTYGSVLGMSCVLIRTERKKRRIRRHVRILKRRFFHPRNVILAQDETDLLLFPPLRAAWALKGQTSCVPLTGFNAKRVVFGAINLKTGYRLMEARERHRGEDFREFLWQIHLRYREWKVALLLDQDSTHTARKSQSLAFALDIKFVWLPARSPELNPMDHLWRHGKQAICANHQYPTIDREVDHFTEYIQGLSTQDALRKAGILSPNFWLR